jgi:dUTP pyrophosphatase
LGEHALEVKQGDRIAQLILEQIVMSPVQVVTELDDTVRGTGGFGSTGVVTTNKKQKLLQEKEEQQADTSIAPTVSAEEET